MAKYRVVREIDAAGTVVFVVEVKYLFTWRAVDVGTWCYVREVYATEQQARAAIDKHILEDQPPKREVCK